MSNFLSLSRCQWVCLLLLLELFKAHSMQVDLKAVHFLLSQKAVLKLQSGRKYILHNKLTAGMVKTSSFPTVTMQIRANSIRQTNLPVISSVDSPYAKQIHGFLFLTNRKLLLLFHYFYNVWTMQLWLNIFRCQLQLKNISIQFMSVLGGKKKKTVVRNVIKIQENRLHKILEGSSCLWR